MSSSIKNRLPFLLILALLVALVAYINWPAEQVQKQRKARVVAVKVAKVQNADFKDVIEALGNARANEQVLITSKYADLVDEVSFHDGALVRKGDILVKLNNQEEAAKVKELEANLAESVAQLNRYQDLLKNKATSKSQVDQHEAQTKAIAAQLLSAKTKLNELTITAPFDGVLGFRQISVGAYIKSGDVITSLDDLGIVKVDFSVPERFYTTIKIGQVIEATNTAYVNKIFAGKVTSIDPRIDNVTRMVKIRAEIPNQNYELRAGMLLKIKVERSIEKVLQIPESAIIPIEDKHFVFVIDDNKALRKQVIVGRRKPGIVEVVDGLMESESVVTEGALKLRDGTNVNVLEQ
ncbi:efflux RND transporter periplasmic adaptor subunit [Thalassotalea sp. M1531]|uniref:Efflux RND transporter periplasmic adaptor subunit n=1 Tax=Thalassotalea algicola TaxID=2716224 RepID=A0A7Y0LB50_9GAMM|nr:efflux RND transporter periplasmic adaptor subunit [Thalassotalea algicola]NMP30897.1 efflux RND transporter periplasmic adaptor subunit [Thalassotalea algicola]